jgi:anti-sigma factor RsiW
VSPRDPSDDLDDLLMALADGEMSPDQRRRLMARLKDDPSAREAYAEHALLNCLLSWEALPASRDPAGPSDPGGPAIGPPGGRDEAARPPSRWPRSRWIVSLAAAALLAALIPHLLPGIARRRRPDVPPVASDREAPAPVVRPPGVRPEEGLALVVRLDSVRWEAADGPRPTEGTILAPGRFRLLSGRASLAFYSGVTLTLEGPADVDLVSMDRVFCRRGKLRARVPRGAEGFVVASPGSAVVDLGTEFALNVEDGGKSRVRVFEGMAEAALIDAAGSSKRTQLVERDEEFELDPATGRIEPASARPEGFVAAPDLTLPPLVLDPGYAAAVLRSRPRGYWRFEAVVDGAIPDEVADGPPLRVAGPVALSGGPGDNHCAVFRAGAPGQFLSTDGPWELAQEPGHAVEFWFLPEVISHASLVGLYPPLEAIPAGHYRYPHTFLVETTAQERQSLNKPASVRFLHRWLLDTKAGDNVFSEGVYVPRRWYHVVAQKEGDRMELSIDGSPVHSSTRGPDHPIRSCYLVVGRRTPDTHDPRDVRPFVGRMDELAIYDHPLSAEEIRRHFRMAGPRARPD